MTPKTNLYEIMFILKSSDAATTVQTLHGVVERFGGQVVMGRPWDEAKLAYPIGREKKGLYYILYARVDTQRLPEIDREFKLNENVVRYMSVHVEPKLEERILAAAQEDRARFFVQTAVNDDSLDDNFDSPRRDRFDGPRRPPVLATAEAKD